MEGFIQETGNGIAAIVKPRFPHLKPKTSFEIIQYKIGRKEMAARLEVFYKKFKSFFDLVMEPAIRANTEPHEIVSWYYEVADDLCESHGLSHNIAEYFADDKSNRKYYKKGEGFNGITIDINEDVGEFYGFGIEWILDLNSNYKNWLLYIICRLSEFGAEDMWSILAEVKECHPFLDKEWIDMEKDDMDPDDYEASIAHMNESLTDIEREEKDKIKFNNIKKPKRLFAPKTKADEKIHSLILAGIAFVQAVDESGKTLYDFYDPEEQDNYGLLPLERVFFICRSWMNPSPVVEKYVFEESIDETANQIGICRYRVAAASVKDELDLDIFNFEPISKLILFHSQFSTIERQIRDKK